MKARVVEGGFISTDLRSSERSRVEDFAGAADGVAAPGSCTSDRLFLDNRGFSIIRVGPSVRHG